MALRTWSLLTTLQLEAEKSNGAPTPRIPSPLPRLSFAKPCWVVKTESNVQKEVRKQPDPPCVVCKGSGRADCHNCRGRGRTNFVHLAMLPKGEWPKWCRTCGGSGLSYCSRCVGTGEYRYIMGFHFMKMDVNHTQDHKKYEVQGDRERRSASDILLNEE